ncbi:SCO family protein [Flavobacterium kingsejongi]|uniref:SCO family protein n=1 Tax=Flavobacterium kingsejongi TaxID=1678728 RepID=A0A2S1LJU4_9FLAO|nr:SCO family protein [Flavobacterium kingsejongi]AWG24018.1 SCO family protein [Flavobacterium kingsejongi]
MMKNKSYIGISFIILIFGIYAIPKIISRLQNHEVVQGDRLNKIGPDEKSVNKASDLYTVGPVPQFILTNQDNQRISNKDYQGKVFLVEFFFSTCPTICPIMNQNMRVIDDLFYNNPQFGIVSITINPEFDTPEVLKKHAQDLGVKSKDWNFLTGDQEYIHDLSNKGFNIYTGQNSKVAGGFEHSGLFALVDKKGNIRCRKDEFGNPIVYYDGIEKKGLAMIKEDIRKLLAE